MPLLGQCQELPPNLPLRPPAGFVSWCCNFFSPPRGSSAAGAGPSWVGGTRAMPSGEIWGENGPNLFPPIGLTHYGTSCAIRGARGGGIGRRSRSPPGFREELGWAGCGPGGPTWPLGRWPLGSGSVAGDPDRHWGCGAPLPLLRTGGWRRPGAEAARVLSAHSS
jgi:hypothetical protein